ncbi:MAG: hypothetical protein R3F30_00195 [Planctomycetota bacterium]
MRLEDAHDSVLLGESLASVREGWLWEATGAVDPEDLQARLAELADPDRLELDTRLRDFLARLCRRLAERHEGDPRIALVLLEWSRTWKGYEVFDALLAHDFEFAGRDRLLEEGRRLFPSTMTGHWTAGGEGA